MKKLKIENQKLKSQISFSVEKVDCEVPDCHFKEECTKCNENSKVSFKICQIVYHRLISIF